MYLLLQGAKPAFEDPVVAAPSKTTSSLPQPSPSLAPAAMAALAPTHDAQVLPPASDGQVGLLLQLSLCGESARVPSMLRCTL